MGKYTIVASYLVRIALHEKAAPAANESIPEPPTNEELEKLIGDRLYEKLPYFTDSEIGIRVERTDR
jgi:hypothetical protein